jgi:antitoxin (DNA-binding transcriptional repressor) of toxin-antitoxin stability system
MMKKIAAAKFKEQCLSILDNVDPEGLVITKHGKPVAKLFPVRLDPGSLIGAMRGRIKVNADILSTGMRWDAES